MPDYATQTWVIIDLKILSQFYVLRNWFFNLPLT